jgi:serine acetyltransferase
MNTWHLIRRDAEANDVTSIRTAVAAVLGLKPIALIVLFRVSNMLARHHVPLIPDCLRAIGLSVWGAEIWPTAGIGPGLQIAHPAGIVIGSAVEAGADLMVFSGVVVGASARFRDEWQSNQPRLGDRVILSSHAVVAGGIQIGDDVVIGANAVVLTDVPANHTVKSIEPTISARNPRSSQAPVP